MKSIIILLVICIAMIIIVNLQLFFLSGLMENQFESIMAMFEKFLKEKFSG